MHRLSEIGALHRRLAGCLLRWITRCRDGGGAESFAYHAQLSRLIWPIIGLVLLEGTVLEVVLAVANVALGWQLLALATHGYALFLLTSVQASMITRPHLVGPAALLLRDGAFAEVAIPFAAITGARRAATPNVGRSGLKVDEVTGTAVLAHGDGNVVVTVDPDQRHLDGAPAGSAIRSIAATADDPAAFLASLHAARAAQR